MISKLVQDVPWIKERLNKNIWPKHIIVSRHLHYNSEPTLVIHTAGQLAVWEIAIREAANNKFILDNMSEQDRELILWIYKNDLEIQKYHYPS